MFSLLGDFFSVAHRNMASAIIGICIGFGTLLGQVLGGLIGPIWGWRVPFMIVSVPSIILAFVVFFAAREPQRGAMEEATRDVIDQGGQYHGGFSCSKVGKMFSTASNIWIFSTAIIATVPWGAISVFANDYLAENKGLGESRATWIVIFFGVGAATGNILGGYLGQNIYNRDRKYVAVYMMATTLCGALPMIIVLDTATTSTFGLQLCFGLMAGVFLTQSAPNSRALLLNLNLPEIRGANVYLCEKHGIEKHA
jgi:predicted MFS family arabinose efflux permease